MLKTTHLSLLFAFTLLVFTTAHAQFGKEWLTCGSDADCVKVNGLCGRKDSINKKFIKDFDAFVIKMAAVSSCSALSEKEKNHNENSDPKCIGNQCKLEDTAPSKK